MSEHLRKKKLTEKESDAIYAWLTKKWKLSPKQASDFLASVKNDMKTLGLADAFWNEWVAMSRQSQLDRLDRLLDPKFDERQKELF
jgi:hypothetical protein